VVEKILVSHSAEIISPLVFDLSELGATCW